MQVFTSVFNVLGGDSGSLTPFQKSKNSLTKTEPAPMDSHLIKTKNLLQDAFTSVGVANPIYRFKRSLASDKESLIFSNMTSRPYFAEAMSELKMLLENATPLFLFSDLDSVCTFFAEKIMNCLK
jgi:hypothetical protein